MLGLLSDGCDRSQTTQALTGQRTPYIALPKRKTRCLTFGHGSGSLVPYRELLLLWLVFESFAHNQHAALMPMMVGMMVCAVVVVAAAEDHSFDSHVKCPYTRPSYPVSIN